MYSDKSKACLVLVYLIKSTMAELLFRSYSCPPTGRPARHDTYTFSDIYFFFFHLKAPEILGHHPIHLGGMAYLSIWLASSIEQAISISS